MSNYIFNPLLKKKLQLDTSSSVSSVSIPEYSTDPSSPTAGDTWVLRTGGGTPTGGGLIIAFIGGGAPVPSVATGSSGGGATGGGDIVGFIGGGMPFASVGTPSSVSYQLSFKTIAGAIKRVTLG